MPEYLSCSKIQDRSKKFSKSLKSTIWYGPSTFMWISYGFHAGNIAGIGPDAECLKDAQTRPDLYRKMNPQKIKGLLRRNTTRGIFENNMDVMYFNTSPNYQNLGLPEHVNAFSLDDPTIKPAKGVPLYFLDGRGAESADNELPWGTSRQSFGAWYGFNFDGDLDYTPNYNWSLCHDWTSTSDNNNATGTAVTTFRAGVGIGLPSAYNLPRTFFVKLSDYSSIDSNFFTGCNVGNSLLCVAHYR
jgi:hypothetical protein